MKGNVRGKKDNFKVVRQTNWKQPGLKCEDQMIQIGPNRNTVLSGSSLNNKPAMEEGARPHNQSLEIDLKKRDENSEALQCKATHHGEKVLGRKWMEKKKVKVQDEFEPKPCECGGMRKLLSSCSLLCWLNLEKIARLEWIGKCLPLGIRNRFKPQSLVALINSNQLQKSVIAAV